MDVLLRVFCMLIDPMDCAALRLAVPPHMWGPDMEMQRRRLPNFNTTLYQIAVVLRMGLRQVDERLIREYARRTANFEGSYMFLNWAKITQKPSCALLIDLIGFHDMRTNARAPFAPQIFVWRLVSVMEDGNLVIGPQVRVDTVVKKQIVKKHYEGIKGAERRVRMEKPDGHVEHYEGEKGAERCVRIEKPDGSVHYYGSMFEI